MYPSAWNNVSHIESAMGEFVLVGDDSIVILGVVTDGEKSSPHPVLS